MEHNNDSSSVTQPFDVKAFLLDNYKPCNSDEADFHLTSSEIYERLISVIPSPESVTISNIASWLHEGGFIFKDFGDMRFEWLFKRNN